jgi:hypothetical protein
MTFESSQGDEGRVGGGGRRTPDKGNSLNENMVLNSLV